jgi:hypothetical protein
MRGRGGVGRGLHQAANGGHQGLDGDVVRADFSLQFGDLAGQFLVRRKQPAQLDESPDHVNTYLDGPRRVQHAGRHDRPVLGEGVGEVASAAVGCGT